MAYTIRISGTVLSSLLYECANSPTDFEGLLLGTLSFKSTLSSDDSQEQAERRQDFMLIHGYQILKEKPYDQQGNLLKHVFSSQQDDLSSVVGYFIFRRNSEIQLYERDHLFMKSYANSVPHGCMAIFSSSLNSFTEKCTHTYGFAFWDMKNPAYYKLPLDITNMSESTLAYKTFMSTAPYKPPLTSNNMQLFSTAPANLIIEQYDKIFAESIQSLQVATDIVSQKEQELLDLKKQLEALKKPI